MENIIRLTNEFILSTNIDKLPIRFKDLEFLLSSRFSYTLMSYQQAEEIIKIYKLSKYLEHDAFLLNIPDNEIKLVLYSDNLSTSEKLMAIAHELGHIVLNHSNCGVLEMSFRDTALEKEADIFAFHFLAPLSILKSKNIKTIEKIQAETLLSDNHAVKIYFDIKKKNAKEPFEDKILKKFHINRKRQIIPGIITGILVLAFSIYLIFNNVSQRERLRSSLSDTKTYYITQTGRKYHVPTCYYVAGRKTYEITLSEALERDYLPCKICRP